MEEQTAPAPSDRTPTWQNCDHCPSLLFNSPLEFERHIQEKHSIRQGTLVLCQYGPPGLCAAQQFGDLRRAGFKYHVRTQHLYKADTPDNWTFYSSSQNLPAVLNDPNRGKQSNFFTKTWGDSFVDKIEIYPSPYLPEITLAHFENFCKRISKRYQRHCRLKESPSAKPKTPTVENACEVPSIFYEQSLKLNDPEVFSTVFPSLQADEPPGANELRSLQETLSTYLDVIEMKISEQVAQKSDAFFHAMLSHDTIMEQMAHAVKTVRETRKDIAIIKSNLGECPLKLIRLTRANKNMGTVHELLKLMGTVQQTQPMIQLLLSTSDYVAALDLISSTQKVLATRLSGIQAFRHLSPQLTEMKRLIHKMLSNEFQRSIVSDLSRPPADDRELPDRDTLVSIVSGILRMKELDFIDTFKVEAMTSIQATIKQSVIEIVAEREGNSEIVLRGTNSDSTWLLCKEGITFLQRVTPNLINIFKRIICISNLILEISQTDDVTGNEGEEMWSEEEIAQVEEKLRRATGALADHCHERCANLLLARAGERGAAADLAQLSALAALVDTFTAECEAVTGHSSNAMTLALRSYATKFVQSLHSERRVQLNASLDAERWKAADVPCELQAAVDSICQTGDIPAELRWEAEGAGSRRDAKFLIINKESYSVVGSAQLLVRILLEYVGARRHAGAAAPGLARCAAELLRLYNSRCCQLVLGAGAIRSAGLKTISTSNLALVARSLQVLLWLLPPLRRALSAPGDAALDAVQRDMASHLREVETKICVIVGNMVGAQLAEWEARPPVPSQAFRNVSKHLVKLHEALADILPPEQIRLIYRQVHEQFRGALRARLGRAGLAADGSPQHGLVTAELTFYLQTLKTLRIVADGDPEDNILYDIWLN